MNQSKTTKAGERTRHTQEQWQLDKETGVIYARIDDSEPCIAIVTEDGLLIRADFSAIPYEQQLANAELIVSAPETRAQRDELLAACQEIIEGMIDGPNSTQKNVTAYAINKVRAAIAKAEKGAE